MMKRFNICLFWTIVILICLMGCTQVKPTIIQTNKFVQTDYDYNCLQGDKTFSEIIICYQTQDKAEKAQNAITNALIKEDTKK